MDAPLVYSLLQEACRALDLHNDHAIAALVGQCMAMLADKYGLEPESAGEWADD